MTINIPIKTQKNGTLSAYILVLPKKNLQESIIFSRNSANYIVFKEIQLSKYKKNITSKFVNLIKSTYEMPNDDNNNNQTNQLNSELKPITHLITNLNLYSYDCLINFNRFHVPVELYSDLKYLKNFK